MHLGLSLRLASAIAAGDPISITVDTAPSISGTAKVGSTLTRTAGSYSGAGTITVSNGRWQRDGVDIDPAETGATYTLVAADDLTSISWREDVADSGGDSSSYASTPLAITRVAPVAAAGLSDVSYTTGSGDQTVDASADFTGGGIVYSVSTAISGVTINSSTGVVTIPTGSDATGTITVTGTNSGGADSTEFGVTIAESSSIPTTSLSTIDYGDSDTLTLDTARESGQYADGSWFSLSDAGSVVISDDAPTSEDVSGYLAHGMMLKADILPIGEVAVGDVFEDSEQGWDEMFSPAGPALLSNYRVPFDAALNKAPSYTASNLTVATTGNTGGVVKAVRKDDLTGPPYNPTAGFTKFMHYNVVASAPPVGSVRPPIVGPDLGLLIQDADYSGVRSFTLPTGLPNIETVKTEMAYDQAWNVVEGERRRGFCVGGEDYAQYILGNVYAPAAVYLYHSGTSASDKEFLLTYMLRSANDAYGVHVAGQRPIPGAAQHGVDHFAMAVISTLYPGHAGLRAASAEKLSNLNDLAIAELNSADVGQSGDFLSLATNIGIGRVNQQPALPEHLDYPFWVVEGQDYRDGRLDPGKDSSDTLARYRPSAMQMIEMAVIVLGLAEGGWEALWGSSAGWNSSNNKFTSLALVDHHMLLNGCKMRVTNATPTWAIQLYDAHRATMPEGGTAEPIVPQRAWQASIDFGNLTGALVGVAGVGAVTETASGIDYDFTQVMVDETSDFDLSNLTITGRQLRLSHDGVQFAAPVDISMSGSLAFTGTRWLQERRQNSEGWCPWSVNYPFVNGRDLIPAYLRNVFTGGTIPTETPTNTEAPKVYTYRYDEGSGDAPGYWLYDELTGTMANDRTRLIAGAGLWSNGVENISYQWQIRENAGAVSDLSGETGQILDRDEDWLSTDTITREISCNVTVDDGNGNPITVRTNWVTMPEPVYYVQDFTTDPGAIFVGVNSGTGEWIEASDLYRVSPAEGGNFSGGYFIISGLTVGKEYTFAADITARNGANPIDGIISENLTFASGLPDVLTNELGGSGPGTLTADITATASTMYFLVRMRGVAPASASFDVDEVRATPNYPADATAPVLSSPTAAEDGGTGATSLGVTTDEGNGTLYWGIYPTASTPSAADVVAGTGATVSGSQSVSGAGVQSVSDQTGLTSETAYRAHYVHDDDADNRSNLATSSEFTTDDVTAPTLSSPTGAEDGETGATSLGVSTNEGNGTLYWGIYPTASTPSAADVVAGTGATVDGSQAVSGTGVQSVSDQTGLTADTAYKVHYVQDDAASNRSSVATSAEFTTDAASSIVYEKIFTSDLTGDFTPDAGVTMVYNATNDEIEITADVGVAWSGIVTTTPFAALAGRTYLIECEQRRGPGTQFIDIALSANNGASYAYASTTASNPDSNESAISLLTRTTAGAENWKVKIRGRGASNGETHYTSFLRITDVTP